MFLRSIGTTLNETVGYAYDANDRLNQETSTDGTVIDYTYDHTQQTAKQTSVSGTVQQNQIFEYDLQGRMSAVVTEVYSGGTLQSRDRVEYDYDTNGLRVRSSESSDVDLDGSFETAGETTTYLVDHHNHTGYAQTITEITKDGSGAETKRVVYTFGHDEISQTTTGAGGTETLTFAHDGHGSVRVLLDVLGAVANLAGVDQLFHFTAYGTAHGFDPSQAATSILYSGEAFDPRIGQQYLRARWYDPNTGRFNRLDPFFGNPSDPQSFHKYLYTHADPVIGVDPTGREFSVSGLISATSIGFVLGGFVGAGVGFAKERSLRSVATYALYGAVSGAIIFGLAYSGAWGLSRFVGNPAPFTAPTRLQSGLRSFSQFFRDTRTFKTISERFWVNRVANGSSLHHWLIPQRWTWVPESIRNAGFNLLRMPSFNSLLSRSSFFSRGSLGLNQWMGFALKWGGSRAFVAGFIENSIRVLIPLSISGTSASVTGAIDWATKEDNTQRTAIPGGGEVVPLNLSDEERALFESQIVEQLEKARDE